jgi:ribosome-binding protein aMBF1 (putative translation factor)
MRQGRHTTRTTLARLAAQLGVGECEIECEWGMNVESDNRIRQWREYRCLTVEMLADAVGCSDEYLRAVESGATTPGVFWLKRLGEVLGCRLSELTEGEA